MSAFFGCQTASCEADAEYKCSCMVYFCGHHYKRHHAQQGSQHHHDLVLLPLEKQELIDLSTLTVSDIVRAQIDQEIQNRKETIENLLIQIRKVEEESSLRIKRIIQRSQKFTQLITEIRQRQTIPLISANLLAPQIAKMIQENRFSHPRIREMFSNPTFANVEEVYQTNKLTPYEPSTTISETANTETLKGENPIEEAKTSIVHQAMSFKNPKEILKIQCHSKQVWTVAVSPCQKFIAAGSRDKAIKIWNSETGTLTNTLTGHSDGVVTVNFSLSGNALVSGSLDSTAIVWNLGNSKSQITYSKHSEAIWSACYSPDSTCIASAGRDNFIHIWNAKNGSNISILKGHCDEINKVMFTSDGQKIVSVSDDKQVIVWDLKTGNTLNSLKCHSGQIETFCLFNDFIAYSNYNSRIFMCNIEKEEDSRTINGHSRGLNSIDFSSCGQFMVTASRDNSIKIWDRNTEVQSIPNVPSPYAKFLGNRIVSAHKDGSIRVWKFD